jgi:hypothetical protein
MKRKPINFKAIQVRIERIAEMHPAKVREEATIDGIVYFVPDHYFMRMANSLATEQQIELLADLRRLTEWQTTMGNNRSIDLTNLPDDFKRISEWYKREKIRVVLEANDRKITKLTDLQKYDD